MLLLTIIVVTFHDRSIWAELQHNPNKELITTFDDCLLETSELMFEGQSRAVIFVWPERSSGCLFWEESLKLFHSSNNWIVSVMQRKIINFDFERRKKNFIISFSGNLTATTELMKKISSWNSHVRFLVVSATIYKNSFEISDKIMSSLAEEGIFKVAVLLPSNETRCIVYS